jgi:hypothetical protein
VSTTNSNNNAVAFGNKAQAAAGNYGAQTFTFTTVANVLKGGYSAALPALPSFVPQIVSVY